MNEFSLKYGCNPNQKPARVFMENGADLPFEVLNGKPGFINLLDAFNGYQLVKELTEATGLPRSTYYKKLEFLKEKGYIVEGKGKTLHFYEVSQKSKRENVKEEKNTCGSLPREHKSLTEKHENLAQRQASLSQEQNSSPQNIEINNRYNTDNEDIIQILDGFSSGKSNKIKSGEFVF